MKHTRREKLFVDSLNVFQVKFKFTIKLSLFNGCCVYTVNGFIHERFQLIFNIVLEQLLCLNSNFHQLFFEIIHVQRLYDINSCFNISINKTFVNVAFSFFQSDLSIFERNLYVSCLINGFIFCFVIPMCDFQLILLKLIPAYVHFLN